MTFAAASLRAVRTASVFTLATFIALASWAQGPHTPKSAAPNAVGKLAPNGTLAAIKNSTRPLRMRGNPASQFLQKMNAKRPAATSATRAATSPRGFDVSSAIGFPGFVQAPWAVFGQAGDTSRPHSSVSADFNGDGKADLASIEDDGTVNVLLSSPTGNLVNTGVLSSISLGQYTDATSWLIAADMNHDGKPDLVSMTVFYGGGGGIGFTSPGRKRIAGRPRPSDSIDNAGTYLLVYLNDGAGNFSAPIVTSLQTTNYSDSSPWNFAVGDVNGDGITDVVVISNELVFQYGNDGSVSTQDITIEQTYLNNGDGTLATPLPEQDYSYNNFLQPLLFQEQLVDMNHDGKLDLVSVIAPDGAQTYTTIQVQLGNGDGTFAPLVDSNITNPTTSISVYNGGGNLVVADINHDGYPDAILASNTGSAPGQVYVALNQGNGTLGAAKLAVQGIDYPYLEAIDIADMNADGNPDLLLYSYGQIAIYKGNGDGTFSAGPVSQYVAGYSSGSHAAPADFNGDGKLDVADVDETMARAGFFYGNGDLTLQGAPALAPPSENASNVQAVASGNFLGVSQTAILVQDWTHMNADFYPDMYTAYPDGKGGLKYTSALTSDILDTAQAQYIQPITADLNGDGASDLILAISGGIGIAYSNKDGSFAAPVAIDLGVQLACSLSYVDAGDINGDGYTDIVAAYPGDAYCYGGSTTPSGYFTMLNNHDGTFTSTFTAAGNYLYQPKLIDLNGDGILDLVIADDDSNDLLFTVTVLPGKGDGTFDSGKATVVLNNYSVTSLIAGDFNGDGKQDLTIATAGETDGNGNILPGYTGIALLAGHGDLTFDAPVYVDAGHLATWGTYTDLNGDKLPDLALAEEDSTTGEPVANLVTLINNGNGAFTASPEVYLAASSNIFPIESYTSYVFVSDVNLDGSPDVINTGSFGSGLFINSGGVTLTLSSSPTPLVVGTSITLTGTVTSTVSAATPGGSITFLSDGVSLGTSTISGGAASFSTSALTTGTHTIEARYSGDAAHNLAVADAPINVLAEAPDFSISSAASTLTVADGTSANLSMSLGANGTFTGAVQITCIGAPAGVTCTTPTTINLTAGQVSSFAVTVSAGASSQNRAAGRKAAGGFAMAIVAVLLFPRRRRLRAFAALVCLAVIGSAGFMAGCGSGGSNKAISQSTLTITATAGTITKTQTVALTVTKK
jgi:Bacterial Ig-like domain (group 3)/FG-GAP-like repeat